MPLSRRQYLRRSGGLVVTGVLGGCASTDRTEPGSVTVRVGSKPFTEQLLLGYLAYARLRAVDRIRAVDEIGAGDSLANWDATGAGDQHLYWEYTGTAWVELPPRHERRITDPDALLELVRAEARPQQLRMAEPAPFSNEYVIATDAAWAERRGISTISELAAHLRTGDGDPGVALNEEFYHRQDGWRGLVEFYGVGNADRESIESGTFIVTSIGLTYELLEQGDVRIASGFATDPQLGRSTVAVLEDDRDYFLPYQPAPTAYSPLVDENPGIFELLAPVAAALDRPTMRRLNRRVLVDGEHPFEVAKRFLQEAVDGDA